MFNHKGGVSKTTSVYNIGWMLAKNLKVLIVDADPQCNLSALILGDNFEPYYMDQTTKLQNIKDGVKVAFEGKPSPISAVNCYSPQRAPSLFLLAGHANLSEYDAALTFAQTSNNAIATLQNLPGAFSELLRLTEEKYSIDLTIIDMNPSLSAINQNLFISSHSFIVPTNPDPFSVMATLSSATIPPREYYFEQEIISKLGIFAFQAPDKIADGLSYIWSEKHKWQKIAAAMAITEDQAKKQLKLIVDRRNKIAHEADVDIVSGGKFAISKPDCESTILFIERCGEEIVKLVA
jgi:cellulose biosynthesis protein BcsQ